jgi:hypothetical protein
MRTTILAAAAAALLIAGAASAQSGSATSTSDPRARVEQHIADMHATLHITPAQEPLWDQFAQVMLDNAQQTRELVRRNAAALPTQNAAEIMASYSALVQQHAQAAQKLTNSFNTVYAALSPEQRREADAMFRENAARRQARKSQAGRQSDTRPSHCDHGGAARSIADWQNDAALPLRPS